MNNNPYSKTRAEARKKAREQGLQTSQRNWDNYSVGTTDLPTQESAPQQINSGEISKIVNDSIASIKQNIINEVTQSVLAIIKDAEKEKKEPEREKENTPFTPVKAPMFNYKISAPDGSFSGIIAEIPFKPSKLHVLGLKGEDLEWVPTEDC